MAAERFEKVFASWIYFLLGISTVHIFWVGLSNGIVSGTYYPIQQKLLIGAALTGAATLLVSAMLVHFRPATAYVMAMIALPLLLLAFWPLLSLAAQDVIIHRTITISYSLSDLFAAVLLPVVAVFTPLRVLKLVRS